MLTFTQGAKDTAALDTRMSNSAFQFLDLPLELQRKILEHLYPPWDIHVKSGESAGSLNDDLTVYCFPDTSILTVCQHTYILAKPIRDAGYTGCLRLDCTTYYSWRNVWYDSWIRARTTHVEIFHHGRHRGWVPWPNLWTKFPELKEMKVSIGTDPRHLGTKSTCPLTGWTPCSSYGNGLCDNCEEQRSAVILGSLQEAVLQTMTGVIIKCEEPISKDQVLIFEITHPFCVRHGYKMVSEPQDMSRSISASD